jgi:hypothetical protein
MNTTQTGPALSVSLMDIVLSFAVKPVKNDVLPTFQLELSCNEGGSAAYTLIRYRGWVLRGEGKAPPKPVGDLVSRLVARMDAAERALPIHSHPEPASMLADAIAAEKA